jgi:hypothetical protein
MQTKEIALMGERQQLRINQSKVQKSNDDQLNRLWEADKILARKQKRIRQMSEANEVPFYERI